MFGHNDGLTAVPSGCSGIFIPRSQLVQRSQIYEIHTMVLEMHLLPQASIDFFGGTWDDPHVVSHRGGVQEYIIHLYSLYSDLSMFRLVGT